METILAPSSRTSHDPHPRTRLRWTGRILSGLIVAFLAFDAAMKLAAIAPVVEATTRLGYAMSTIRPMGVVLLLATVLYVVPRTAVLGALLTTAYLGGATATLVRAGDPSWFPIALGVLLWASLMMRQPRLRALLLPVSA